MQINQIKALCASEFVMAAQFAFYKKSFCTYEQWQTAEAIMLKVIVPFGLAERCYLDDGEVQFKPKLSINDKAVFLEAYRLLHRDENDFKLLKLISKLDFFGAVLSNAGFKEHYAIWRELKDFIYDCMRDICCSAYSHEDFSKYLDYQLSKHSDILKSEAVNEKYEEVKKVISNYLFLFHSSFENSL